MTEQNALNPCADSYSFLLTPAWLEVERETIGANAGVNGYTTVGQAERLVEGLQLAPGKTLLDVGSGRGWPGAYIAERTGCEAVLMDVPRSALVGATERYGDRPDVAVVQAGGAEIPFASRTFDAVSHADVLC